VVVGDEEHRRWALGVQGGFSLNDERSTLKPEL
jgi:hypothetical protein